MEEYLEIIGGQKLQGKVNVSGSKNGAVAIVSAALAVNGICLIENVPQIEDVKNLVTALRMLGAKCRFITPTTLEVDARGPIQKEATFPFLGSLRASYYFAGALLGRYGEAAIVYPGGCNFGSRPIDLHLKAFEALGATVNTEHGIIRVKADKLVGATIYFDLVSVGATINAMMAAAFAEGTTVIENAAKEPHVVDTANFLNMMGANVKGAGTDTVKIVGVKNLVGGTYTIIPDQIVAGTYMIAAAMTGGDVVVENIIPKHMESLTAKLREMNCHVEEGGDFIRVRVDEPLQPVNVKTMAYPGFPTDLQPQMTALLSTVPGTSIITETIFDNRFQYVNEMSRLGAQITVDGRVAVIEGTKELSGADVTATDLRAGVALVMAGLSSKGMTRIGNVKYIDRGYVNIEKELSSLGAQIKRVPTLAGRKVQ